MKLYFIRNFLGSIGFNQESSSVYPSQQFTRYQQPSSTYRLYSSCQCPLHRQPSTLPQQQSRDDVTDKYAMKPTW